MKDVYLEYEIEKVKKMQRNFEIKNDTIIEFCAKHFFELGLKMKGGTEQMQTAILPDGVTKRDIKKRMIEKSSAKSVIKKLIPGFYNEELPPYYNIARFLNAISEQNRWIELWDEIK